jgi:hypothetical protein
MMFGGAVHCDSRATIGSKITGTSQLLLIMHLDIPLMSGSNRGMSVSVEYPFPDSYTRAAAEENLPTKAMATREFEVLATRIAANNP